MSRHRVSKNEKSAIAANLTSLALDSSTLEVSPDSDFLPAAQAGNPNDKK